MLIPVNFFLSLICVMLLVQRRDAGRLFRLLLLLCLLHSLVAGLTIAFPAAGTGRWLQPVTAAALPLMCRLALEQAAGERLPCRSTILVLMTMILCVLFLPQAIDWLMPAIWLGCALLMLRRLRPGSDVLTQTALADTPLTHRGWQSLALTLIAVAALDLTISLLIVFAAAVGTQWLLLSGNLAIAGVMSLMLLLTVHPAPPVANRAVRVASSGDDTIMSRLDALMLAGLYREPQLNLARLARKAGIPTRQVSAAINGLHQQSVSQYVNGWRIREASERLALTHKTVIDVMEEVGFQTKSNFNREFLRITGKTPSQWRREAWEQAENH